MWIQIAGIYLAGLVVTAMTLFRTRMFQKDHVMNTGSILLWPVYWILYGIALIKDRQ